MKPVRGGCGYGELEFGRRGFGRRGCGRPRRAASTLPALLLALALGLSTAARAGTIRYVKADATGTSTGLSWPDAYPDLQLALAAAQPGDEIWVAAGTYKPTTGTDRTISFVMKEGVALYGGFSGAETARDQRDWTANVTTLSGDIGSSNSTSDNSYHVILGAGSAMLDGLTIAKGGALDRGGGVRMANGAFAVANCIFSENGAGVVYGHDGYGGAISCNDTSLALSHCTFSDNYAYSSFNLDSSSNRGIGGGGAVCADASRVSVIQCSFVGNIADGSFDISGGAIYATGSTVTLTGCSCSGNAAHGRLGITHDGTHGSLLPKEGVAHGGALHFANGCTISISDTTFIGNVTSGQGIPFYLQSILYFEGFAGGGGLSLSWSLGTLDDCVFTSNSCSGVAGNGHGGAIYIRGSYIQVTNSVFESNAADGYSNVSTGGQIAGSGAGGAVSAGYSG